MRRGGSGPPVAVPEPPNAVAGHGDTPPEEVPDDAAIELRVNGETRQSSSVEHFAFGVPELLAEIAEFVTLEPGDVVLTGTPEGVDELADGERGPARERNPEV